MIVPKPDIENFLRTLRREKTTFIPVAELGIHPLIKEQFLNKKISSVNDEIEFWYKAGFDYIKLQPFVDFNPAKINSDQNITFNDDGSVFRKWASENNGIIQSEKDLENYNFPNLNEIDYLNFEKATNSLPDGMGIIGQYGDIFTMTWEMMGFENFSFALFENESLIKNLNERIGDIVVNMFENMADFDSVSVLWYSDDVAYTNSLMVSPEVLDKFFFPWLEKIGDIAKRHNKPLIYHSDGILLDILEKIVHCGVDAIHPIEPKAMDIIELKKNFGDKLCLIGNVEVDLLARGSIEEVKTSVIKNIENVGFNGGYCVGSSNSIPEYVKLENFITMIETTKEFGQLAF